MIYRMLLCTVICLSLIGCKPAANPGTWDQTRIEAHLKEKHKLVEVSLLPGSEGVFTGSGKTKLGETYMFKVKQDAETKRLSWEFNSDRGDVGEEAYEFVKAD